MSSDVSELEEKNLPTHVEKCGLRYQKLNETINGLSKRLWRIEVGGAGFLTAIVFLLAKMAFGE